MGEKGYSTILKPEPLNLIVAPDFTGRMLEGDRPLGNSIGVLLGEYRLLNIIIMKEAYCSYEISKLLKEKGFDEPCKSYFIDYVDYVDYFYSTEELTDLHMGVWETLRPTHQMACAWLREVYNIDIIIFHEKLPNDCYWARIEHNLFTEIQQEPEYNSYEEAVESAIKYCLENLI